ncbi:DNA-directed RNA polymerase core subunit rpc10 [Imshaugia aleurites]|uniref:DNA-directed RNA polymerase core subunit rpc10 n=1 Tax=Imshaugia aleurites TaxID=172621 RepID=A0A8H3EPK3_9LECA|nr:DNA-directed RNA polymerase core subunit rpc10 [Imshaugia aleurites]
MSREAYAPPTLQPSSSNANTNTTDIAGPSTPYECGECSAKLQLKKGDAIRCKECGHRVLLKTRTKRMVQFEAR